MNEDMRPHTIGNIVAEVGQAFQAERPEASAAEKDPQIEDLERRIRELEVAIGDLRSVNAAGMTAGTAAGTVAASGRKTVATYRPQLLAKGAEPVPQGSVDAALGSLSVEQRFAVKAGLVRAGLL